MAFWIDGKLTCAPDERIIVGTDNGRDYKIGVEVKLADGSWERREDRIAGSTGREVTIRVVSENGKND